jgi:hypothetical protein
MIAGTILSIFHFHLMIFFRRRFLVGSFAPILASKQTLLTNMVNIVPLDQLLPYSSRRVTVTFAYTDNRGEHANRQGKRVGGSAYWRIGVWESKTAFRHGCNDQEVSTELMILCKRRHAHTPIRRNVSLSRPIFNATLRAAAGWLFFRPASAHLRQQKEGYKVCAPKVQKGSAQGFNLGNRHAKMRPESGARMKRRARIISIRYGASEYGAPSGHTALIA